MDQAKLDKGLRQLAERQHSVVSRSQARSLGASRAAVARRAASIEWEDMTPRVLRLVGSVPTFDQRCMAAVLDAGPQAVVSYQSAARLWRLPGFVGAEIHVSRLRQGGTRRSTGRAVLHRPQALPAAHLTAIGPIPVTSVARTVFDLAGAIHPGRLERALDNALARHLTTIHALRAVTNDLAEHGRPGSTVMRALLGERNGAYVAPDSGLEGRFLSLLRAAGLPEPVRQLDVGGARWVGRVDLAYPARRLVIEIDSAIHHSAKLDREADGRRDNELVEAGYRVIRITDDQIWFRPHEALATVRDALRASAA
jgi:hypothetical protein